MRFVSGWWEPDVSVTCLLINDSQGTVKGADSPPARGELYETPNTETFWLTAGITIQLLNLYRTFKQQDR